MADSLTHRTVKNSVYSLIGFTWPLLLSFVATPIIVRGLGVSRFGFFTLLNTMLMLFGLLDFGISYTLTKRLSENREQPGGRELSEIFSSSLILYAILGAASMFLLMLLPDAFRHLFKIPEGFISSYGLAFFILGAVFLMKMLVIPLSQIPYALQRQDITTNISLINNGLLQLGSIYVIKTGHGVLGLLVVQLISAAFLLLSLYLVWHRLAPNLKFIFTLPKETVKTIGRQGAWVFLSNTMGNILAQLDKFVLGAILGPTTVGYYGNSQLIPEKISATSFSLSYIFFPIFSEASVNQQEGENRVKVIFRRSLGLIPIVTAALAVLVLVYGYQLMHFWINKDVADHTALAVPLLTITYFLLSFGHFFHAFLSGLKELRLLALSFMVVAGVDVVFMFILIPHYAVNGAAFAYLLSSLPVLPFIYYIERRYFKSARGDILAFYGKLFAKIFLVGSITFLVSWFALRPFVNNLPLAMLLGALSFVFYFLVYWRFGFFAREDEALFKVYLARFLVFLKLKAL